MTRELYDAAREFARANSAAQQAEALFQKVRHNAGKTHTAREVKEHLQAARLAQAQRTRAVARLLAIAAQLDDLEPELSVDR